MFFQRVGVIEFGVQGFIGDVQVKMVQVVSMVPSDAPMKKTFPRR